MSKRLLPAYLLTFVNVLGFSILMPILPFVVEEYGAPEWFYGLLLTLYSAFQFFGSPYLGELSDRKGRKPILIVSQAGTLLCWVVFAVALSLPNYPILGVGLPIIVIALARILDGITGGNTSVTNAYVSDITTRKEKAYIFGYLGGIAGIGMIVGPGIGGLTASTSLGYMGTIFAAMAVSIITLIAIFLWLKESHPPDNRGQGQKHHGILHSISLRSRIRDIDPSPVIKRIFLIKAFFASMMAFYIGTIALFLIDLFDFNPKELGIFLFVVGVFLSINQAFVSKLFIKRLGEFKTLILGLIFCTAGLFSITLTSNLYLFIGFYYIMNLGLSLCFPTFNALIAIHANPKKQGEIMGVSESINSLAMALFPVVSAAIYGFIGFELYYLVSAMPFIGLIIALFALRKLGAKAFD